MALLTTIQRQTLEHIVKMLNQGEKPGIPERVARAIVNFFRELIGDLVPHRFDCEAFNDQPVKVILQAILDADAAMPECPDCPEFLVAGPLLADSYIADEHHADGELNYDLRQSYQGGLDDPAGAAKVEVQIATTDEEGTVLWEELGRSASWYLTIGDPQTTHMNQINDTADRHWQMRCRFVDASDVPLSEWAYSDYREITNLT